MADTPIHHLLLVLGRTPLIVIETLHCLNRELGPTEAVGRIEVLTTLEGQEAALHFLIGDERALERYFEAARPTQRPEFSAAGIRLLVDADGAALPDVRSTRDNEAVADQISRRVEELTSDPNVVLHASVAGGRKTMGIHLAMAMVLHGRKQDGLYHVLASPAVEQDPAKVLDDPHGLTSGDLNLCRVPFPSLSGYRMSRRGGRSVSSLPAAETVRQAQRALDEGAATPVVHVEVKGRQIAVGGASASLRPRELSLILTFLWRKTSAAGAGHNPRCPGCYKCGLTGEELDNASSEASLYLRRAYEAVKSPVDQASDQEHGPNWASQAISKLKRALSGAGPGFQPMIPRNIAERGQATYVIALDVSPLDESTVELISNIAAS